MITGLGERIDEHSENFNEKLENIWKKNRTEEYSNWGGGEKKIGERNNRPGHTEDCINNVEDRIMEITQSE